jgi:N-acetylglucosaminyl-diphospho-decaprenol L-rhamnosyltransferase
VTTASIVVNYKSVDFVRRLLASGGLSGTEVIVVDNGSEPAEVVEACNSYGATAVLLPENIGFAAAVNAAVTQLEPGYGLVLLVNPDVSLGVEAVAQLRRASEELEADAVCPVILVEGTERVQGGNGGGPLSLTAIAAYYWFVTHLFPGVKGLFLTRAQIRRVREPLQLDWLCMACLLVRRDAFTRYGDIPEDEIAYSEDIAWGTRASAAGARLFLVPGISVEHKRGASKGSSYEAYVGSLRRLLHRRMAPTKARLAYLIISSGLWVRRAFGRQVE